MKGFIELHELYSNKPLLLNVNLIDHIGYAGIDDDIKIHGINSVHRVRESYKDIIHKIKQAIGEE